jgi:membrane-associated phospholipid phosphatase
MTVSTERRLLDSLERATFHPDGSPRRGPIAVLLAASYAMFAASYLAINEFNVGREARTLFLPGESAIPFIPEFEYVYALAYVLPFALVWKVRRFETLLRAEIAFFLTLGVSCAFFLAFPVTIERPAIEGDSIAHILLAIEYLDRPYNLFPSLHAAFAWLVVIAGSRDARGGLAIPLAAAGISVSTVFVKQHYIVDILAGACLAPLSWWAAGVISRRLLAGAPR